jgi:hypothetical protein
MREVRAAACPNRGVRVGKTKGNEKIEKYCTKRN